MTEGNQPPPGGLSTHEGAVSASQLRVTVVIPTYNESANIVAAIESAAAADEVLVVDGGSTDDTLQRANPVATRVFVSRPGRGPQQNAAAAEAGGDVLLFLHADCRLHSDAVARVRAAIARGADWGGFVQHIPDERRRFRWLETGNLRRARRGMVYGDQGLWVRAAVFAAVGGFPEWPLMEDVELSRRLGRRSRPVLLNAPLMVSPRRWHERGVVRQTVVNRVLLAAYGAGVSPSRLARWYRVLR